jgi:hypothetical protein
MSETTTTPATSRSSDPVGHLEASVGAEKLQPGSMGVVMARAGVGKTACLVQIALDRLLSNQPVFHVALGQTVEHVHAWYDALFDDRANATGLEDAARVRAEVGRHRLIAAFGDHGLGVERVEKALAVFTTHMSFQPRVLLVDGFEWEKGSLVKNAAELGALKAMARRLGAVLWMTAQTHREVTGHHPIGLCAPCESYGELIDVALFLEGKGEVVDVRVLKAVDGHSPKNGPVLRLHTETMRLVRAHTSGSVPQQRLQPAGYTLLSGAAPGAETEFGMWAEKFGLREINYTFNSRPMERQRGVRPLSETELLLGDVSSAYLRQQMHRNYPDTPTFRKVLQLIWHEVSTAGEVFVVGLIQEDKTVRGGTGWAAELGKHWQKPVHVYDQEKKAWFSWNGQDWAACTTAPTISRPRFCGTGTRFLSDDGKAAIRSLFERSFTNGRH